MGFGNVVASGVKASKRTAGNGVDDAGKSAKSRARLAGEACHGASKMATSILKGSLVDFLVILIDDLNNMPTLYSELGLEK
jgi:hypothetical protein